MKSDIITVTGNGRKFEAALAQADAVATYKRLSPKSSLQLHLLAEEMMCMMRSIAGASEGEFWIEEKGDNYSLHLLVFKRLTEEKREQLLSASSSGKNEAARGFLGKLRSFFDVGAEDVALSHSPLLTGSYDGDFSTMQSWEWSMMEYRNRLSNLQSQDPQAQEAWDELEKSVIANVADEIKVSIKGDTAELIVFKHMQ